MKANTTADRAHHSVVMMGATGAVGGAVLTALQAMPAISRITLLGRRAVPGLTDPKTKQHSADIFDTTSYAAYLPGHSAAVCTLGVGQPSKTSKAEFLRVDRDAVLNFAAACKAAGVSHFSMLSSVSADSASKSFYLRSKGELEDGLIALGFGQLSLFHPSMILTPQNRYGFVQGVTLAVWPWLTPLLRGPLRKFRGVPVAGLGTAIAQNLLLSGSGNKVLEWDDFRKMNGGR